SAAQVNCSTAVCLTLARDPGGNKNGLLASTSITPSGGATPIADTYRYNAFGEGSSYGAHRGSSPTHSPGLGIEVKRDKAGRIQRKVEHRYSPSDITNRYDYVYDVAGRLDHVVLNSTTTVESYNYDLNGNRTSATNNRFPGAAAASTTY